MAEFVRGRGRRSTARYVLGSLLVFAVALGGLLVVDWLTLSIEVDEDAMRMTTDHLDEVGRCSTRCRPTPGPRSGPCHAWTAAPTAATCSSRV